MFVLLPLGEEKKRGFKKEALWKSIYGNEIKSLCFFLSLIWFDAVVALMSIKTYLIDPYNVLENWDITSVDPCSWRMVTCSADGYVSVLWVALVTFFRCCLLLFKWFLGINLNSQQCGKYISRKFSFLRCALFPFSRGLPSQSLSGTLSPWIGNLSNLQSV